MSSDFVQRSPRGRPKIVESWPLVGWGERASRMARVAASILTPHVIDHRVWLLQLNLQCRDERVMASNG